jgi:predicted transcriptional regulator
MESDAFTLYKLILLFLLSKVDFPLTNAQLSSIILDHNYTNYFNIQFSLSELLESELIHSEKIGHSSYYRITDSGRETLSFFDNMISQTIQRELLDYLKEKQYSLRDEVSTLSEFHKLNKNEYSVRLRVLEKNASIIDLNIIVPSEDDAKTICNNWRKQSQQIYAHVLISLLSNESEEK